jgi:mannose-6-phosphate isomerase-like protein (cupin superfamily)
MDWEGGVMSTKIIDTSPVLGVRIYCEDAAATDLRDEPFTAEMEFKSGAASADHIHPRQDETYVVLSGTIDLFMNQQWRSLGPGESLTIPRGTVHAFRNSSSSPVRVSNAHDPGLRTQEYLESLEELVRQGKLTGLGGLKNGIYLSLHSMEFREEFVSVRPPDWLIRLTAKVGTAFGFRLRDVTAYYNEALHPTARFARRR